MLKKIILLFAILVLVQGVIAEPQYPHNLRKYVTDNAGIFSAQETIALNEKCAMIERNTSIEIAVITMPDTDGQDVVMYAAKTGQINGIGKRETDNGIVLLISFENEPGFAIATGRGAETYVPDAYAFRLAKQAEPLLNAGEYYQGFDLVLTGIEKAYAEEPTPAKTNKSGTGSITILFAVSCSAILIARRYYH